MKKILIAEDHHLVREAFINMLQGENGIYIVGEVKNGEDLINQYFKLKPHLVLADIEMPIKSGPEAARTIIEKDKDAKILFLSQHEGDEYVFLVYKSGGKGLISKAALKGELLFAIDSILAGNLYFADYDTEELESVVKRMEFVRINNSPPFLDKLTEREKEILFLIGKGLASLKIGEKLFISKRTVDYHRSNIMQKLNLSNLAEMVVKAVEYVKSEEEK